MKLRISSFVERTKSSLFFVPMVAVIVAAAIGVAGVAVDRHVDTTLADLPLGFTSTVESARTLLGVIAAATISFAGIAFSVSLLTIQLASSQYSPRVVHTLFRDPFNKRVMALVAGTFTYCLVVLRSVRSALDSGGDPVIPNISVAVAVVLGIATILATVAFINHSAHSMDISEILERIRRETTDQIRHVWVTADPNTVTYDEVSLRPTQAARVIRATGSGWVQQIDAAALLGCIPEGSIVHVETHAGRYAIKGSRLLTLSPAVAADDIEPALRAAFVIGDTRTMQQDVSYGLRQLVDVTVKALSPGINDPTTAQDAIFHSAAVLAELLCRDPPPVAQTEGTRQVVMAHQPTHRELIQLAFDEPRRAAATQPTVCLYLLWTIESLIDSLDEVGLQARTDELHRQARLVAKGCGRTQLLDDDIQHVRQAHSRCVASRAFRSAGTADDEAGRVVDTER